MNESEPKAEPKDINEELVLVGFGKHDLTEVVEWIGTHPEIALNAAALWPARWRRLGICGEEEIEAMKAYVEFTAEKLNKKIIGGL
jgi:hypothetical protein